MNDFTFYSPTKFIFGREAIEAVGEELSRRSFRKALIVYGGISAVRSGVLARVKASLDANGVAYEEMRALETPLHTRKQSGIVFMPHRKTR